jgi:uncharacterized membrane protein YcaP (DUF421 family)
MDQVLRAAFVYVALLIIFRLTGKRSLAETTPFDLVLLLIFSEVLQTALVDDDNSVTAAMVVILTLVVIDIGMSLVKQRFFIAEKLLEGVPLVVMDEGKLLPDRMNRVRIDEGDILAAARQSQGLESLDQVKIAVLERSGGISIIPWPSKN